MKEKNRHEWADKRSLPLGVTRHHLTRKLGGPYIEFAPKLSQQRQGEPIIN